MNPYIEAIIGTMAVLGALCTFIYWVFGLMEKRLEAKIDAIACDVHRIADELREERRSKDFLYKFVVDYVKERER
jgi:hypothetical protein